jgi:hypothetical protein
MIIYATASIYRVEDGGRKVLQNVVLYLQYYMKHTLTRSTCEHRTAISVWRLMKSIRPLASSSWKYMVLSNTVWKSKDQHSSFRFTFKHRLWWCIEGMHMSVKLFTKILKSHSICCTVDIKAGWIT